MTRWENTFRRRIEEFSVLHCKQNPVMPAHRAAFFLHLESSAVKIGDSVMQPSCSHLHRLVIIALIMWAVCRLMVTVLSLHVVFRQKKWGSHFTQSFPPKLSSPQSCGCCQSLKMTPISTIWCVHLGVRVHVRDWRGWQDSAAVNWTEDVRKTRTDAAEPLMERSGREKKTALREEAVESLGKRQKEPYPLCKWESSVKSKAIMMQPNRHHKNRDPIGKETGVKEPNNVLSPSRH